MKKNFFIICIFFIFLFLIPFYYHFSFSKYVFTESFTATKIQIQKKPLIEVIGLSNTNSDYEKYANSTHLISLRVKITEKNVSINQFDRNHIQVFVDHIQIYPSIQIYLVSNDNGEMIYDMIFSKLTGNGNLFIVFPEGIIVDSFGLKNDFQKFDTGICIDNISPTSNCEEISIENNQSQYVVHSNENLRPINGWDFYYNSSSLAKIFSSPISYPIVITDYAGNTSQVHINVQNATNMMLYYVNYNTNSRIINLNQNGEISGKQTIIDSSFHKSEMILTCLDGNVDSSILQARVFDYTYWGKDTSAVCEFSEIEYQYGYTPSATSWYDITSQNTLYFDGKLVFQLGGDGHNLAGKSCLRQFNPIPEKIAKQNLYGLSGIAFQLKDCNDYSIVYQIYVPSIGWLKAASDGEETTYSHDKPFSAIRMNIVPKSEKQTFINYWNQVIYTDYVE